MSGGQRCPVCQSDALQEDEFCGALVCADCGTQLASFLAEANDADADVVGVRYKRRRSSAPPPPPPQQQLHAEEEARGEASDVAGLDADERIRVADLPFEQRAAALQDLLLSLLPQIATLARVELRALQAAVGELWFRFLRATPSSFRIPGDPDDAVDDEQPDSDSPPARRPSGVRKSRASGLPALNSQLALALAYLGCARLGTTLPLAELVRAAEAGTITYLRAFAALPRAHARALCGRESPLRPRGPASAQYWETVVAGLWAALGVADAHAPDAAGLIDAVATAAGLPPAVAAVARAARAAAAGPPATAVAATSRAVTASRPSPAPPAGEALASFAALREAHASAAADVLLGVALCYGGGGRRRGRGCDGGGGGGSRDDEGSAADDDDDDDEDAADALLAALPCAPPPARALAAALTRALGDRRLEAAWLIAPQPPPGATTTLVRARAAAAASVAAMRPRARAACASGFLLSGAPRDALEILAMPAAALRAAVGRLERGVLADARPPPLALRGEAVLFADAVRALGDGGGGSAGDGGRARIGAGDASSRCAPARARAATRAAGEAEFEAEPGAAGGVEVYALALRLVSRYIGVDAKSLGGELGEDARLLHLHTQVGQRARALARSPATRSTRAATRQAAAEGELS